MCGIVAFWDKTDTNEYRAAGRILLAMLHALGCRGPDSAGVALYGPPVDRRLVVRVKLGDDGEFGSRARQVLGVAESFGEISDFSNGDCYARFLVSDQVDQLRLVDELEVVGRGGEVLSVGRKLEIMKQVGSPANLLHPLDSLHDLANEI